MRLTCRITAELSEAIKIAQIKRDQTKAQVLRHLVELAIEEPDAPKRAFGENLTATSTVEFSEEDFQKRFTRYRVHHLLESKTAFLKDALERGMSIYLGKGQ